MRAGMLALVLGLLSLRLLPALPAPGIVLALSVFALTLLLTRIRLLGLFVLGLCWACTCAQWALDDRLAPELDGRTLWLEGRVVGLPQLTDDVTRFELVEPHSRRAALPARIRLSWRQAPPIQAGDTWRLAVTLRQAHGMVNPHGFDYEAWLLAQGIGATGSVKAGQRLSAGDGPLAWRDQLRQKILASAAWGREGAIAALVLGDGSGLSQTDWRMLQHTGTVHLMVISGQHITLLAGLLYALVALLARLGLWPSSRPWLPWACALAMLGALGYGLLAGFEVPVQRACAMIALVLLWRLRFRHLGLWLPLLVALLLVLLVSPLAVLQPGFWLSFLAVAVLVVTLGARLGRTNGWLSLGRVQWAMSIGLLPAMLMLALPVSLSGPLANLLAVPWVGLIVVPLSLLGTLLLPVPLLGPGLLWLAGAGLEALFVVLGFFAQGLPAWLPVNAPWWAWLLAVLGAAALLLPAGVPVRALGVALLLPALLPRHEVIEEGVARIWLLDVGQGLSVLVQTREHALLYDAGAALKGFDIGERVVLPSLRALGVSALDTLVISHGDNDHAGGAGAVIAGMPVAQVISGEVARLPVAFNAQPCTAQRWQWNAVQFRLWRWVQAESGNAGSCVLSVEANGMRLLLTGDIDAAAERALMASDVPLAANWLLLAHHGSRSSSTPAFLAKVAPKGALLSRGRYNSFSHPHPQVVARLAARQIPLHDTAEKGALLLWLGRDDDVAGLREQRRFWREK